MTNKLNYNNTTKNKIKFTTMFLIRFIIFSFIFHFSTSSGYDIVSYSYMKKGLLLTGIILASLSLVVLNYKIDFGSSNQIINPNRFERFIEILTEYVGVNISAICSITLGLTILLDMVDTL